MLSVADARLLDDRDRPRTRARHGRDPVAACMVASRVELAGLDPWRLGGELWGGRPPAAGGSVFRRAPTWCRCAASAAVRAFAERARRAGRTLLVDGRPGRTGAAGLWEELSDDWGPAREIRSDQPLMVLPTRPAVPPDPQVRPVRPDELDRYLPAAVAMFTEEVGVDPAGWATAGRATGPGSPS